MSVPVVLLFVIGLGALAFLAWAMWQDWQQVSPRAVRRRIERSR